LKPPKVIVMIVWIRSRPPQCSELVIGVLLNQG